MLLEKKDKVLFSYLHYSGWGDSLISLFSILNCAENIRKIYPNTEIDLIINDCSSKNINLIFPQVFDLMFFKTFFNEFTIQEKKFYEFTTENKCFYKNEEYYRIYSGRNKELIPNIPGIFDVFIRSNLSSLSGSFFNLYLYDNEGYSLIKNYPIFNAKLNEFVGVFIKQKIKTNFKSIHYRLADDPSQSNIDNIQRAKNYFKHKLDKQDTHLLCTNHGVAKKELLKTIPNCCVLLNIENHLNDMINGYCLNDRMGINDAVLSIIELLIISKSNLLYCYSDYEWVSYFTFYARRIQNIPYINLKNENSGYYSEFRN